MTAVGPRLGVCSWSLQPTSAADLAAGVAACGLSAVQLALDPIRLSLPGWGLEEARDALKRAGIAILSGMMATKDEDYSTLDSIKRTGGLRPDETWRENLAAAAANAEIATQLGISLVTFHAGFLPHDWSDPERKRLLARLAAVARAFGQRGVGIALETGQESAATLLEVLKDLRAAGADVGVNFDPANMILYGMGDPVQALRTLAPHTEQIHIKDAALPASPGAWGTEVVAGTGAVDWATFFEVYRNAGLSCDLVIEREAGSARHQDIIAARELVQRTSPIRPVGPISRTTGTA